MAPSLFVFMDWRHLTELTTAGRDNDLSLKNLVVWLERQRWYGQLLSLQARALLCVQERR